MVLSVFSLEFTLIGLVEGENVWLLVGLLLLIPLVWKIPLMISVYKKFKDISTFFDFVNEFEEMLKSGGTSSEVIKEVQAAKSKSKKKK